LLRNFSEVFFPAVYSGLPGNASRLVCTAKRSVRPNVVAMIATFLAATQCRPSMIPAKHYTTSDGLARDSVHCILRDRNSFLWFATGEGISRFDGYQFTNYRVTDGLPDRDVRAIVEAQDGSFLVATGGGAARFDPYGDGGGAQFAPYLLNGGYKAQSVRSVVDAQGMVWIGTDAGLFVVRNGATQIFRLTDGAEQPEVTSLARDADGNVWVGSSEALYILHKQGPAQEVARGVCRHCWRKATECWRQPSSG
jgi:hypothetical protein